MSTGIIIFNIVFGVLQLLFSISAIIAGSVCLSHSDSCHLDSGWSGALVGAGVVGLVNNVRMILMYCAVGHAVGKVY